MQQQNWKPGAPHRGRWPERDGVGTRRVEYHDREGRKFLVEIPAGAPDTEAVRGALVGPPSLEALGLPLGVEIRLNHELFGRGLFTERDIRRRAADIDAALMAALRVDRQKVQEAYALTADTEAT